MGSTKTRDTGRMPPSVNFNYFVFDNLLTLFISITKEVLKMSAGRKILKQIFSDLSEGYVEMALLGSSSESKLKLDTSENLVCYSDIMRPNIAAALKKNRNSELIIYIVLIALFVVAIILSVYAANQGPYWKTTATIPGLGVTAAWPILKLIRLRKETLKISLMPELLPLLKREDMQRIVSCLLEDN